MTRHFILMAIDAETVSGARMPAYEIACHRLRNASWPLFKGTKNRNAIGPLDKVLIYIAGRKEYSQSFIAHATVGSVNLIGRRREIIDPEEALTDSPFKMIGLRQIHYLQPPASVYPLLGRLSFLPDSTKWGGALVGGCRSMKAEDFDLVLEAR